MEQFPENWKEPPAPPGFVRAEGFSLQELLQAGRDTLEFMVWRRSDWKPSVISPGFGFPECELTAWSRQKCRAGYLGQHSKGIIVGYRAQSLLLFAAESRH